MRRNHHTVDDRKGSGVLRTDDRGVSEVLGASLVFALLVTSLTIFQVMAIPSQNAAVEYKHNQRAQTDVAELGQAAFGVAETGESSTITVRAGMQYPNRFLFVNPPPPTGTVRTTTVDDGTVRLVNATAVDADAADFFDGGTRNYTTKAVVYEPAYNEYEDAPRTVYSTTVLSNHHGDARDVVVDDGELLAGDRLSLVLLEGNLSESAAGTVSVDLRPTSASTETVRVTGNGDPIRLRVPTPLSAAEWRDLLADEFERRGGNLQAVNAAPGDAVHLVLNGSVTYTLQVAKLSVGQDGPGGSTPPAYATKLRGNRTTVDEGTTQKVVVQVNDEFGNPVGGATVFASANRSGLRSTTATTGDDGTAEFVYAAPDVDGDPKRVAIDVSTVAAPGPGFDAEAPKNVSFDLVVRNSDLSGVNVGGGGNGSNVGINPAGNDTVMLEDSTLSSVDCGSDNCNVTMVLNNTFGQDVTVERARFNFFSIDTQGRPHGRTQNIDPPSTLKLSGTNLTVRDPFEAISGLTLGPGTNNISMRFFQEDGDAFGLVEGDYYVLTVVYDVNGTTEVATYFVAPE